MKTKNLLTLCLLTLCAWTAQAQEWYDVTQSFLKNTGFDTGFNYVVGDEGNVDEDLLDIPSWTPTNLSNATVAGIYQFGTQKTFLSTAVPPTGFDGTAEGGCLVMAGPSAKSVQYVQSTGLLAPGNYKLVVAYYNTALSEKVTSQIVVTPVGGTVARSRVRSIASRTWIEEELEFKINKATTATVQIGYLPQANTETGDYVKMVYDYVKLMRDHDIDETDLSVLRDELQGLLSQLNELAVKAGSDATELHQLIADMQALYDNSEATMSDLTAAIENLKAVMPELEWEYSGKVTMRYVRGATKCFVRVDVEGIDESDIVKRGTCLSSTPEPTQEGTPHSRFVQFNGSIYGFDDLTPCTKYYLNAYVMMTDGRVKYAKPVKFYTIPKGQVSCTFYNKSGNTDTDNRIQSAITSACDYFNNMTSAVRNFGLGYSAGTPTADCNYTDSPWINMGANSSYQRTGTLMHEMQHGMGLIPYTTQWNKNILRAGLDGDGRGTGQWLGDRATYVTRFWANDENEVLTGDYQHMWPYGINGAHEDNGGDPLYLANASLAQALGEDGLEHNIYLRHADPYYSLDQEDDVKYYLKNESEDRGLYSAFLVEGSNGAPIWKEMSNTVARADDHNAWYVTFTPANQQYQFRNAATGKYLTLNGQNITLTTVSKPSTTQDFHLMKARVDAIEGSTLRGYWMVRTASYTPSCMIAKADGGVGVGSLDLHNTSTAQRWLIMNSEEIDAFDKSATEAFKVNLSDVIAQLEALQAVPHTEDAAGTDEQLSQTIQNLQSAAETVSSAYEVSTLVQQAQQAEFDFLSNATPTDMTKPFDLSLLITNAGMDAADGWSTAPALSYSCGEFYQKTFNMNQNLQNMPAGTYQLRAQAFQRPGTSAQSYSDYLAGQQKVTTYLYINSTAERVCNISVGAQPSRIGTGSEVAVGSPSVYLPNTMEAVSAYFARGLYENEVTAELAESGNLRLGIRCSSSSDSYWSIFDNFRLYFFGKKSAEEVTGIDAIENGQSVMGNGVFYDLQGRQVMGKPTQRGIYIFGGKKVVIK